MLRKLILLTDEDVIKLEKYLFIVVLFFLTGCAADVLYSQKRSPMVDPVSRINILFVGKRDDPLGVKVAEMFPKIFSDNGLMSEAKNLPNAEIPSNRSKFSSVFSNNSDGGLVLLITPISTLTNCYGGCVSRFRVRTELIGTQKGNVFWIAEIDLPFPETRWSDYSGVAGKFANSVLERLRTDAVLPSGVAVAKASQPKE